jgi:hypothetical protein
MVSESVPTSSQPTVTRIRVDYDDGSSDDIGLLQGGELPVYDLRRAIPGIEMRSLGAHSHGAIAAILFHAVTTTQRIEYSLGDPTIRALLSRLFGRTSSEGGEESANHADAT